MPKISDTDLQMFRERAKTELASGCDVSRLRWDDIVESLCKEVVKLRGAIKDIKDFASDYERQYEILASGERMVHHVINADIVEDKCRAALT